ncbi:FkbM family methyltransferase [Luteibacter sp. PPL552]
MEKHHRRDGHLGLAMRQAARGLPEAAPFEEQRDEAPVDVIAAPVDAAPPLLQGRSSIVKRLLRTSARWVWRLARPFVRGPAHRIRYFLAQPLRAEILALHAMLRDEVAGAQSTSRHAQAELIAALQQQYLLSSSMHEQIGALSTTVRRDILTLTDLIHQGSAAAIDAQEHGFSAISDRLQSMSVDMERIEAYAYRSALRFAVPVTDDAVMVRTVVGYVLCDNGDPALVAHLLEAGELETGTRLLIQSIVKPGDTFVDVGANVGMHTVAAARVMQGRGRIVAFEAFPRTARLLSDTLWMNGLAELCTVHDAAVSSHSGEQVLFLGRTSGHHSLFPLGPGFEGKDDSVVVRLVSLDEAIEPGTRVDVLKIDVEGAELDVLDGARRLIGENPDIGLIVELGPSHLRRVGHTVSSWLDQFSGLGFGYQVIDEHTGELQEWSRDRLETAESVNLYMRRTRFG